MRQEANHLSDGEHLFAFQYCQVPKNKDSSVLHVEYLGFNDKEEDTDEHNQEQPTSWNQNVAPMNKGKFFLFTHVCSHLFFVSHHLSLKI